MNEQDLQDLYKTLLQSNRQAFDGEAYDVAYHTLMTALHCTRLLAHVPYVLEVERLATEQLAFIDAHHPEYEHSTESASKRSHHSVFLTLAREANAISLILKTKEQ